MKLIFQSLQKKQALAIINWDYPYPYNLYSFHTDDVQEELYYLLDQKNAFFAILNQHKELEGYCSFGSDGQVSGGFYSAKALDIGMGIRPDLVGQGRGKQYSQAVAKYAVNRYSPDHLRVTIASFNKRAQKVWRHLGFKQVDKFLKFGTEEEFIIMTCAVSSMGVFL